MSENLKWVFILLGWVSLGLGAVGIFLPILPTTPFVLLAAYFFSKGSERLSHWLLNHRIFGKLVRDWQEHGVIARRNKWLASLFVVPLFSYTIFFVQVHEAIKLVVTALGITLLVFIWTRPSLRS